MSTISPSAPLHAFLPQNIPEPWGTLHPTISPNATEPRFNIGNYYGSLNNMPYSQQPQLFQHYGLSQVVTNPFPPLPPPLPQLHVPPPLPPPEPNPELHVAEDPIPVPEFDEEQAMDLESDAGDGDVYMVIDSGPTMAGTDPSLPGNINDDLDDGHSIASSRAQSPVPAPAKRPYEPYQTSSDDSPIPGLSMGERPAATPSPAPPTPIEVVEEEESAQPPSSDERKAVSTLNPTVACWVPLSQRPDKPAVGTSAEPMAVEEISTPQETRTDPPKLSIQQPVRQVRAVPLPTPSPTIVTVQKLAALAPTPETGVDRAVPASKRSLLERQRELEERIAYVKEELARRGVASSISAASAETTSSSVASGSGYATRGSTPSQVAADGESRPAIDTGKRQVPTMAPLQIQPSDAPPVPPLPTPALSESTSATGTNKSRSTSPSLEDAVTPESGASTGKSLNGATMSLDELAISFITETIQTVNTPPPPAAKPTPPPEKMSQAAEKMLLAAKQKRLEQHIAESKMLMAKLGTARSKEERESILSTLRERRRAMEEDMKADAVSVVQPTSAMSPTPLPAAPAPPPFSRPQSAQSWKTRWPETAREANILIISDDEDDEDDE
ncbi:hypothetical protein WOLCODRAFT_27644 [Wolfiporia cocos MD-104 SS10]|uniref:Uncharacterized protein n=1 Tax=Wolfiporia cocos (strain MD-104) TaxID=742152 RepID=A0A2H3IYN5_WOLCO|nr:hypothetical protein WOLCODRAFT_27644 [Wolfiporia cocos MD-104 SS10]